MVFSMNPRVSSLHLEYALSPEGEEALREWDRTVAAGPTLQPTHWHMFLQRYLRSATVTASTQIEGNPLSLGQVDRLLQGDRIAASPRARREITNYNNALSMATSLALSDDFSWSEAIVRALNHQVILDLPGDNQGRYREEPVNVGGVYLAPDHHVVSSLMSELVDWLRTFDGHPLIRVALLHLNVVAIHPWEDGNGRTARILSSLELMRGRVGAPEIITIEPYLRAHQEEYFSTLQATLGPSYDPEQHTASEWVNYYVRIAAERLGFEARMEMAWPHDIGRIAEALREGRYPLDWGIVLAMASVSPVRTRNIAEAIHRTPPTARSMLSNMVNEGWLERHGRTRAAHYVAGPRLRALSLRVPDIVHTHVRADTLGLDDED